MTERFRSIWVGYDRREAAAFFVAKHSIERRLTSQIRVHGILLDKVRISGAYTRPTEVRDGRLFDVISEHPMSTEFAISRFLVPLLHRDFYGGGGWALFLDCDMLVRCNLTRLFEIVEADAIQRRYALLCVKHDHRPTERLKMDNQVQSKYARKNWSSFMLFNTSHPANDRLTLEMINTLPGRDLHAFCWLRDEEIGELSNTWNHLVGETTAVDVEPQVLHWTLGGPWMPGYEDVPFAEEWREELSSCLGG